MLLLAQELGQMLHVHTDQRFESSECGTERLVESVRRHGAPKSSTNEPMVWAVHVVSPSTYDDDRFFRLLDDMAELNIGVIVCPSAALGMRMLRPLTSPTANCIPRVLEMLTRGVQVRIGSDNVADICSPSTTANLNHEMLVLSSALRFYQPEVLAKLMCGKPLERSESDFVQMHLEKNAIEVAKVLSGLRELGPKK